MKNRFKNNNNMNLQDYIRIFRSSSEAIFKEDAIKEGVCTYIKLKVENKLRKEYIGKKVCNWTIYKEKVYFSSGEELRIILICIIDEDCLSKRRLKTRDKLIKGIDEDACIYKWWEENYVKELYYAIKFEEAETFILDISKIE